MSGFYGNYDVSGIQVLYLQLQETNGSLALILLYNQELFSDSLSFYAEEIQLCLCDLELQSGSDQAAMGDGNRYMILYHESYHGFLLQAEKEYSLWCSSTFMKLGKLDFSYKSVNGFVRIIGSSKGLICLYDSRYVPIRGDILLWNPDDTKPATLPCSTFCYPISDSFSHMTIGFGFVPEIRDYKIVQIRYGSSLEDHHEVLVYTLSACSWRNIPACASCYVSPVSYASAYVNGEVHWIANNNTIDRFYDSILSFNLFREEFRKIALPDHDRNYKQQLLFPSAYEESLSRCTKRMVGNMADEELWQSRFLDQTADNRNDRDRKAIRLHDKHCDSAGDFRWMLGFI